MGRGLKLRRRDGTMPLPIAGATEASPMGRGLKLNGDSVRDTAALRATEASPMGRGLKRRSRRRRWYRRRRNRSVPHGKGTETRYAL